MDIVLIAGHVARRIGLGRRRPRARAARPPRHRAHAARAGRRHHRGDVRRPGGRDPRRGRRGRRAGRSSSATRPRARWRGWRPTPPGRGGAASRWSAASRRRRRDAYADFFEPVDDAVPFPGWEPFDGPGLRRHVRRAQGEVAAGAIAGAGRRHARAPCTDRRAPPRRAADADLPGVHARPRPRSGSTAGDVPELAEATSARARRHRVRPLADVHPAGRAGSADRRGGASASRAAGRAARPALAATVGVSSGAGRRRFTGVIGVTGRT